MFDLDIGGLVVTLSMSAFCFGVWLTVLAGNMGDYASGHQKSPRTMLISMIIVGISIACSFTLMRRIINRPEFKTTTTQVTNES